MSFLKGKTAIITGAGYAVLSDGRCGSIGYGIATAYAKEGANLVITGRNTSKLEKAKEELERLYNIRVLAIPADISEGNDNEEIAKEVVRKTIDTFGRIDVLINNAQASASGVSIEEHTTEQFNLAMYSGLYATFYYMKACFPYLKETKGSIINFASGAGLFGNYGQCSYAAAKEAIRGLSRVAATEWAKDGINTNVICPLAWTAQLENFEKAYPEAFKENVKIPP
ncbi:MAG: SDR family oxidoreductase, partial [Ruminococcaceae bacterium]|nr:SDR family oxidoreductase [Oscillospiraceae bacterium]